MPKILLVDDEPVVQMLYKRTLMQAGFELLSASNGVEALALLQQTVPDLIVMDIMMPHKDGIATLREIRTNEATRNIPVIIMTANVTYYMTSSSEAKISGAERLLTKPFSPSKLLQEVQAILAAHRLQS